jgi:spore coat protein A
VRRTQKKRLYSDNAQRLHIISLQCTPLCIFQFSSSGAHTTPESDGYPESWFLPQASDIPDGYATEGTFYYDNDADLAPEGGPRGCSYHHKEEYRDRYHDKHNPGRLTATYTNDQPTTTLWYHDHAMGITRLNVYAAAAGLWIIRTKNDGDSGLLRGQLFPGPPAQYGENPNQYKNRKKIREIPLVIQPKSFYDDGNLWYPSNRQYFDDIGEGVIYGSNCKLDIPFLPDDRSDVSPIWNPEAFFDTMVVNGRTWPKLKVANERYRFRILNAADSRFLNLALFVGKGRNRRELPFYVIGSDQSMLPFVTKVKTGKVTRLNGPRSDYQPPPPQALLIGPSERYDVIVDFSHLNDGDHVFMINTGPDEPFGGWEEYADGKFQPPPADPKTTGKVMKFIVDTSLNNPYGDQSTPAKELNLNHWSPGGDDRLGAATNVRVVALHEEESTTMDLGDRSVTFQGPVKALLGTPEPRLWSDPIDVVPAYNSIEVWEIENRTVDAHPIHLHLVKFQVVDRLPMKGEKTSTTVAPFEEGWKDTVIAYPGEVTVIKAKFDIKGLFVWHCHILSHEDNEMMLPFCVGECGVHCPSSVCT